MPKYVNKEVVMYINTFRYTPKDVDCKLCTEYAKKRGCCAGRCRWLAERMEAGTVGYEQTLLESFPVKSPFRWRLRLLLDRFSGSLWRGEKHIRRMEAQKTICGCPPKKEASEYYAALYLLTSDSDIYKRACNGLTRAGIDFRKISLRGASPHAYTVIAAAKSIYTGNGQITDMDLAAPQAVGIEAFELIIHALLIVRYGLDVLNITTKKAG